MTGSIIKEFGSFEFLVCRTDLGDLRNFGELADLSEFRKLGKFSKFSELGESPNPQGSQSPNPQIPKYTILKALIPQFIKLQPPLPQLTTNINDNQLGILSPIGDIILQIGNISHDWELRIFFSVSIRQLTETIPNWAYYPQSGISNLLSGIIYPIGDLGFLSQIKQSQTTNPQYPIL